MSLWASWVERCSRTESATSLALFRIAMGLGVLLTVGSVVWHGLVPVLWIDVAHGGYRALGDGPWLVAWLGGPTPGVIWPMVAGSLLGGLLLTLGIGGRPVALATLLLTKNVVDVNGHAGGSYDELLGNALWLCVLANGQATLSVTALLKHGVWWPEVQVLAFPRWLAAWQLVLMYCATGLQKVSAYWVPGGDASALYYIMQQPTWQRFDMSWVAWVFPLTQVATTTTWFWEVLAPLWILALWLDVHPERGGRLRTWSQKLRVRWVYAVVGIVVHAMIFATMEVGPFSFLSLGFYTVMVHPWEWEGRATRWRTWTTTRGRGR